MACKRLLFLAAGYTSPASVWDIEPPKHQPTLEHIEKLELEKAQKVSLLVLPLASLHVAVVGAITYLALYSVLIMYLNIRPQI